MNFFTTNSNNLSNPSSFSMTSALSAQNNSNTTSSFGTSGGLFGTKTQTPSFGFAANMPNPQGTSSGFGNILQSSNMNSSNTNNGGFFKNDAPKAQGGLLGNAFNTGKENVSTNNNTGLGGWKAAGAQMQSVFGSQISGLGVGSTGSQSLTSNFMGGSANGNSNSLISSTGTIGYSYNFNNLSKTKESIPIFTVTGVQGYREKTIDELRGEDYKALKNNGIPDQRLMELKNMWQNNQSSSGSSGSTNLLSMITSNNSNTQQTNPTLNSFSQNQSSVSNLQNNLFGNNNNAIQARPSTPVFGPSSGPSLNPNLPNLNGSGNQQTNSFGSNQNQGGFGSLLGQQQQQTQPTNSAGSNSGLMMFSSQNQNQNQQSQGGLFQQSRGGLFNQTSTAQTANVGVLGGSGNSLLGSQNSTLAGNSLNMGSGFGLGTTPSNNTNNNIQQASVVGTQNPFIAGGGGNSTANAQGAGLFNSANINQQQQSTGLFNTSQPSANPLGSSMMNQNNALNAFGMQNQSQVPQQPLGVISQNTFQQQSFNFPTASTLQSSSKELWSSVLQNEVNISFDTENWQPEVAVKQYDLFGTSFGYRIEDGGSVRQNYPYNNENMFSRNMKSKFGQSPFEKNSERKRSFYQSSKALDDFKRPYPHSHSHSNANHSRIKTAAQNDIFLQKGKSLKRVMRHDYDSEQNIEKKKNADIARFYNYITVCVVFNTEDNEEDIYTFDVGLNDTCSELKNHILKQVLNSEGLNCVRYKMLYNQQILKGQMSIQEAGLKDREKIHLIPDFDSHSNSEDSTNLSEASRKCLASEDIIPVIPKHLKTLPALVKLSRMSEDELANIQDFTVYNDNARVVFPGKTDIRGMNLGEMIVLGHRSVEVYPQIYHAEMPRAGKGLNKKAIIEFYNWALPSKYENQASDYVAKLKKKFNSLNAEYKKYDVSKQSLVVSVQNFSSL